MKKSYLIFLFTILFGNVFLSVDAQIEISGQVKDRNTKEALMYCSVSVYNLQDSLVTGGITNDRGFFILPLQSGIYKLVSSYIGYHSDTLNLRVGGNDEFLGIIKMEASNKELAGVEVRGSTYQAEIDKEVQLVTTKMRTGSANTSDVLERISGLAYDRYNNSIKVDGDDNVIFLVNGLKKNQEYIKNISPLRLKQVEIIRSPGGRYALDGYSAIINIILKSDYRGTEFYTENTAMVDLDTKEDNYLPTNDFLLSYNYTYDKLNIYIKANNNYTGLDINGESKQEYKNGYCIKNMPLGENTNLNTNFITNTYTAGIDYYINPKQTISFESNISALPTPRRNVDHNYRVIHSQNGIVTDDYTSWNENNSESQDFTNTLFYILKIDKKNTLNADFTYSKYINDYTNSISQSNGFESYETGINNKDYTRLFLELNHTINSKSSIMAGYGNTWRKLENNSTTNNRIHFADDYNSETNNFSLTETRHKLYAYYSLKVSDIMSFKLGVATEYSHPKAGLLDKTYFIYLPHLDINCAAHKFLNIKLKYRANSDYPSIKQVTPFTHVIDPYTIETGNPNLKPEQTHNVSARFRFKQGLVSIEPYCDFSNNRINRIISPVNESVFEYGFDNVGKYLIKGVKGNISIPFFKQSVILQSYFDFFQSSISYNGKTNKVNDWLMNTQLLYINKKYATVTGLNFQKGIKKLINAQGYDYYNNDYWLFFVQKPLFKNKMTLMLGYMLPIDFGVSYEQGSFIETEQYKSTTKYDISMLKNTLMVKLSYRFNKGNDIRNIEKEIEKEIENKSKGLF